MMWLLVSTYSLHSLLTLAAIVVVAMVVLSFTSTSTLAIPIEVLCTSHWFSSWLQSARVVSTSSFLHLFPVLYFSGGWCTFAVPPKSCQLLYAKKCSYKFFIQVHIITRMHIHKEYIPPRRACTNNKTYLSQFMQRRERYVVDPGDGDDDR